MYFVIFFILQTYYMYLHKILYLNEDIFTMMSISSCKFLQVAASVSDVPNSKYHSLFFMLENKRVWQALCLLAVLKTVCINIREP